MVGWYHRLNGHKFEQMPGDGEGQGGLACCSPWGCKVGRNWATELNWTLDRNLSETRTETLSNTPSRMRTLAHTHKQVYDNSVKWTASHSNPVSLRLPIMHTLHLQPCTWDVEVKHEDKPGPSFSLRFQLMSSVNSLPYVARPKQRVSRLKSRVRVCQGASVLSDFASHGL